MNADDATRARPAQSRNDIKIDGRTNTRENKGAKKVARGWQGNSPKDTTRSLAKNDVRYWKKRIFKPLDGRTKTASPHYSVRVAHGGARRAVSLGTGNADAAAARAREFYQDVLRIGLAAAVEKVRPSASAPDRVATIGEWVTAAQKVSAASKTTVGQYAGALRMIAGQILAVTKSPKRFGPGAKGGATAYRNRINAASLDILSPEAIQQWRLAYVAKAKNPVQEGSRMTSANSLIKQARSLFGEKIVRFLPDLRLPDSKPFVGCEFYPRQSTRYFSRMDPKALLQAAHSELAAADPPAFLAMILALAAGLRKGEIDSLCWHQLDLDQALIRVESTAVASLKTVDSRGEVPIDPGIVGLLRGYRAQATGVFVIGATGEDATPKPWGRQYRASRVFERLYAWLRKNGVTAQKPLHTLRKELGALITSEFGIYAASRVLRHSDVATTARHYADQKTRATIKVSEWLTPGNVTPMNPKPGAKSGKASKMRQPRRTKAAA